MASQAYTEKSMKFHVLDVNKIRVRPVMYLGDTPAFKALQETVDNATDEFSMTKQSSKAWNVFVRYQIDPKTKMPTFTVADRGRGIPVGVNKEIGMSTMTGVLTMLQAGGKFDDKSYAAGKGTHGCGVAATNAVSSSFEVWTFRDKKWHYQSFAKGQPTSKVIRKEPAKEFAKNKCGTVIKFTLDKTVSLVANDKVNLPLIKQWLYNTSMIDAPIRIKFEYQIKDKMKSAEYYNPTGAVGFLKAQLAEKELTGIGKPFIHNSKHLSVICQWASTFEECLQAYTCGIHNIEGGTQITGFYAAMLKAFNEVSPKKLKTADIKCGMMGFVNVKLAEAQYKGQTKEKLMSPVDKDVAAELYPLLKTWLTSNKSMLKAIVKRALEIRKANEEVSKIMKAASGVKNHVKGAMLPGILATADSKTPAAARELFLVEGESAGGPAKAARDRMFQEVMCLSGKPLNALRHSLSKVLASKPVQNMLISLGVDPTQFKKGIPVDPKFRVGRVILLADGDNDGAHISNLILSVFYKLVPSLFDLNMVYVVDAPLFSAANKKGEKVFGYTLKEVQSKCSKGSIVTRLKGWGECERDDLADIAFDLQKRKLFLVKPVDKKEGTAFVKVVGDDVTMRKQILGITATKEAK